MKLGDENERPVAVLSSSEGWPLIKFHIFKAERGNEARQGNSFSAAFLVPPSPPPAAIGASFPSLFPSFLPNDHRRRGSAVRPSVRPTVLRVPKIPDIHFRAFPAGSERQSD